MCHRALWFVVYVHILECTLVHSHLELRLLALRNVDINQSHREWCGLKFLLRIIDTHSVYCLYCIHTVIYVPICISMYCNNMNQHSISSLACEVG